ncbi:MAG TPA: CoA-binding protein, partial [Acidimicrobiia bacterium]|nr:CoA-binding protein [Acidimicrobiia bacterium]
HPSLGSLPDRPDIVNVVVPPGRAIGVVDDWAELGGGSIWFQPGSYDREVLARARDAGMSVVDGDCIMVVSRRLAF